MKKRGFTLAEILVSVGIVGVIAAIMLPMVNKYKPDENKILYIKAYDSIYSVMPAIVNNRLAYPHVNKNDNIVYSNYPLFNVKAPFKLDGDVISGPKKFCRMLATGLNTVGSIVCTDDYLTEMPLADKFKPSFETANGVQFMVQSQIGELTGLAEYQSDIFIDVNGAEEPNCFVTENSCNGKMVDRFKLMVSSDGVIKVGDPMGQYFLDTRANWKLNRDLAVTGDMIAKLDDGNKMKPLEYLPKDESDEESGEEQTSKWSGKPYYGCSGNPGGSLDGLALNCIQTGFYDKATGQAVDFGVDRDNRSEYIMLAVADIPVAEAVNVTRYAVGKTGSNPIIGCTIPAGGTFCVMQAFYRGTPMDVNEIVSFNNGAVLSGGLIRGSSQMYILPGDILVNRERVSLEASYSHRYYGTIDEFNNDAQNFARYTN